MNLRLENESYFNNTLSCKAVKKNLDNIRKRIDREGDITLIMKLYIKNVYNDMHVPSSGKLVILRNELRKECKKLLREIRTKNIKIIEV